MSQNHGLVSGVISDAKNPLNSIDSQQGEYLRCYLNGLEAHSFLLEEGYFDSNYLAEVAAYYSTSARGYSNLCKRVHFFGEGFSRSLLNRALSGNPAALNKLRTIYLGFTVIRPIPVTPIGRTVLKWFDNTRTTDRVTTPSRRYTVHVCGLPLDVVGLAWQQQDAAVAVCATVGLWSILHSSAFDDSHFVPTTVEVARAAESFGTRPFPSRGLSIPQIQEAIKKLRLAPISNTGSVSITGSNKVAFSRQDFAATCSSFIRSGYPVLLCGDLLIRDSAGQLVEVGGHAVCAVGMREADNAHLGPSVIPQDAEVTTFYIHDDNIGPSARFTLTDITLRPNKASPGTSVAALEREQPNYLPPDARDSSYSVLVPHALVIAVHENFRISPHAVAKKGRQIATMAFDVIKDVRKTALVAYSARFFKLSDYLGEAGLGSTLSEKPSLLKHVRLALTKMDPMCLHIGVIRLSLDDAPLLDVIIDTTDGDHRISTFCHIVYDSIFDQCFDAFDAQRAPGMADLRSHLKLGRGIQAY